MADHFGRNLLTLKLVKLFVENFSVLFDFQFSDSATVVTLQISFFRKRDKRDETQDICFVLEPLQMEVGNLIATGALRSSCPNVVYGLFLV